MLNLGVLYTGAGFSTVDRNNQALSLAIPIQAVNFTSCHERFQENHSATI